MSNPKPMKYSQNDIDIKEIQEYYDTFLASEPGKWSPLEEFKARYEPVLSFLQKISKHNTKILDVGCGTGMAAEMLRSFGQVYGIDVSPRSIMKARSRLDRVCVSLGEELPFKDEAFDVVTCTETIEHFLAPSEALSEFNRVLKSGGYLIISTPNPWYWFVVLSKVYAVLKGQKAGTGQIVENYLSPVSLRSMLKKRGFEIEEFKTVFFKPVFVWKIIKWALYSFGLYQVYMVRKKVR